MGGTLLKYKLLRITTVPMSISLLLKGQLRFLNQYFDVVAVTSNGDEIHDIIEDEGIKVIQVPMKREISILHDLRSFSRLIRVFKDEKPDIVHANTPKASLLSMIVAWLIGVPIRIYTVTGLRFESEVGFKRKLLILMERITCYFATHINAESLGVKMLLKSEKITRKEAFIIGNGNINGIDEIFWNPKSVSELERINFRRQYNISNVDFCFLFVGRVVKDKGVNELVRAFEYFCRYNENYNLIIVGPFDMNESNIDLDVAEVMQKHPKIFLLGFQKDIRLIMASCDVLVLPSYREGFPNVLLQAGAMGLPIIVTPVNGTEELIDSQNGIIIEKFSIESILHAFRAITNTEYLFDKAYCRNKVTTNYSQAEFYPLLYKFYRSLIND
ncbi:glycosyltransferase family 4 protein [Sediminibacterium salmoneum]|uniref:glycosyltransferase family 4 protein n=1 Tax=Sediminibacterium salmoneum TaxID=426421 RepID=UPI000A008ECB|nr:glycosyltransferase family 4 protein [Sediminibacterium salmoneum]